MRHNTVMIRLLSPVEIMSPDVAHLLWLAAEVPQHEFETFARDRLARLSALGVFEQEQVVAIAAFDTSTVPVTLEYLACRESLQGQGIGSALVAWIRAAHPNRMLRAETDDDAVDFYRRLDFTIEIQGAPDPRWPDRQRYLCTLEP